MSKSRKIKKSVFVLFTIMIILIGTTITITYSLLNKKEEKDTISPVITFKDKITIEQGQEIDLLKEVSVKDNSNEEIKIKIEGEYDINTPNEYTLYYIAKDSSGNETKEKFTLIVTEKTTVTNNNPNEFTTSKGYKGIIKNGITYIDGYLIANKTYALPKNYGTGITNEAQNAFKKLQAAAKKEGYNIYIASGYRSYNTQKTLYNNYVKRDGKKAADTYSARAGHSEHQTGLAYDICSNEQKNKGNCINDGYNSTKEAKWLSDNAYKYGLILRYPKDKSNETGYMYESWHFRYVGVELATKLYNNGNWITMEDYFGITSVYSN